jgi:hypothetical protein
LLHAAVSTPASIAVITIVMVQVLTLLLLLLLLVLTPLPRNPCPTGRSQELYSLVSSTDASSLDTGWGGYHWRSMQGTDSSDHGASGTRDAAADESDVSAPVLLQSFSGVCSTA